MSNKSNKITDRFNSLTKQQKIILGVVLAIVLIALVIITPDLYCKIFHDAGTHNPAIITKYDNSFEDVHYLVQDAIGYAEYSYERDIEEDIVNTQLYKKVGDDYDKILGFEHQFNKVYKSEKGNGSLDYHSTLSEDDYYYLDLAGIPANDKNAQPSEDNYALYVYDTNSHTIYFMLFCE